MPPPQKKKIEILEPPLGKTLWRRRRRGRWREHDARVTTRPPPLSGGAASPVRRRRKLSTWTPCGPGQTGEITACTIHAKLTTATGTPSEHSSVRRRRDGRVRTGRDRRPDDDGNPKRTVTSCDNVVSTRHGRVVAAARRRTAWVEITTGSYANSMKMKKIWTEKRSREKVVFGNRLGVKSN